MDRHSHKRFLLFAAVFILMASLSSRASAYDRQANHHVRTYGYGSGAYVQTSRHQSFHGHHGWSGQPHYGYVGPYVQPHIGITVGYPYVVYPSVGLSIGGGYGYAYAPYNYHSFYYPYCGLSHHHYHPWVPGLSVQWGWFF